MEYIVYAIIVALLIITSKIIFKVNIKKVKELEKNEEVQELTNKFPENIQIAKEMLKMVNNETVKIEENPDEKSSTSLYIAVTDKISIAKLKDNYARIQTIAHECLHSIQDRRILMFNFIFSNIYLLCFAIITILLIFHKIQNPMFMIALLTLFSMIQFTYRAYLEIDAMTKAKYLAKEYMEEKEILTKEEIKKVIHSYDAINKIGIPFILDNLLFNNLIKILIITIITIFIY